MNMSKMLLCLYPRMWRTRYEEEFLALLESRSLSLSDGIDLFLGAIDSHLHPYLGTASLPLQEKLRYLSRALQSSLLTGFCAYVVFMLAGSGFEKLNEAQEFVTAMNASSIAGMAFHLVVAGVVLSLLSVLIGGLPIAIAIIKSAFAARRKELLFLFAVPFLAFAFFVGMIEIVMHTIVNQLPWLINGLIFFGGVLFVTVSSTVSLCVAVARSTISHKFFRFAILPSCIAAVAMVLVLLSTVFWGLSLQNEAPNLLASSEGFMRSSTMDAWLRSIVMMACSTGLVILSLFRAISACSRLRYIPL